MKCKKGTMWSGDFGINQYVSWCLPPEDLCFEVIWAKYEDFCKLQIKEFRARLDLLISFRECNHSVDEWYNADQAHMSLVKYPPETAKILHRDIFWFFLKDEEFVTKNINDSNTNLEKFPPIKVRQLAKKMESSQPTIRHIKQVASDPQAAQVNLMRHQRTDLPPSKSKRKQHSHKSRSKSHKRHSNEHSYNVPSHKKRFDHNHIHQRRDRCSRCGDSKHREGYKCPARKFSVRPATNMVTSLACSTRRKSHLNLKHQRCISCKWVRCMCKKI